MVNLRRSAVSGLVVVGPVIVTIIALVFLLRFIAGFPLVAQIESIYIRLPVVIVGFLVTVMFTGYLTRTAAGRVVAETLIGIINRIPILRVVFNATHLAVETIVGQREGSTRPVKVEAWRGLRVTAFDTGNRTDDGRLLCFFPTAPNISTGYVIEVEPEQIEPTGERIEDALTRLLSAGLGDSENNVDFVPDGGRVKHVRGVKLPHESR